MGSAEEQGQPLLVGACGSSVKAMNDLTTVTFYMEPELCQSAQVGQHNFIRKVAGVISDAGLEVRYQPFGLRGVARGQRLVDEPHQNAT